jgi:hypothetical protein
MIALLITPSANLSPKKIATTLHRPPLVCARADRNIPGILSELWEATEIRARRPARPWEQPETPGWISAAMQDFGRQLLHDLADGSTHIICVFPQQAAGLAVAPRLLPEAQQLLLTRDGRVPPSPIAPDNALAGLAWAKAWAGSVQPALDAGIDAVPVEQLSPAAVNGTLLEPLGGLRWSGPAPLQGAALLGFSCWEPARAALAVLGYPVPARPVSPPAHPALIEAFARGEERPQAIARLRGALSVAADARLWGTLGELLAEEGRLTEACEAWRTSAAGDGPASAWVSLLDQADRDDALPLIRSACGHQDAGVRAAAARWLVVRGMDEESAEALTHVRGERWYAAGAAQERR